MAAAGDGMLQQVFGLEDGQTSAVGRYDERFLWTVVMDSVFFFVVVFVLC